MGRVATVMRRGIGRLLGINPNLIDDGKHQPGPMPPLDPSPRGYYAYLGNDRGVVLLYDGSQIVVDTRDVVLTPSLILNGCSEPWVETALLRLVRDGAVAVDLGANFGYYTLFLARAVGPSGKVYAFEANPHLARLLSATVKINHFLDRVVVVNTAVIDREDTVELHVDPRFVGSADLSFGMEATELDHYTVQGTTLCSALPDINRIDLLRMGIEGSEHLALRGAETLIRNSPDLVIVCKWSMSMLGSHGGDLPSLVDWLTALGFSFWKIKRDATLRKVPAQDMPSLERCDVVISRRDPQLLAR